MVVLLILGLGESLIISKSLFGKETRGLRRGGRGRGGKGKSGGKKGGKSTKSGGTSAKSVVGGSTSVAVVSTTTTSSTTPNTSQKKKDDKTGMVILAVVGSVIGLFAIVGILSAIFNKKEKPKWQRNLRKNRMYSSRKLAHMNFERAMKAIRQRNLLHVHRFSDFNSPSVKKKLYSIVNRATRSVLNEETNYNHFMNEYTRS